MKKIACLSATPKGKLVYSIANALLLSITLIGSTIVLCQTDPVKAQIVDGKFYCGSSHNKTSGKVPTTIFWTSSSKAAIIQWVKPMGNYWTTQRRCSGFSQNINEIYQASGAKFFLTNGKKNGQKVICSADEVNGDCKKVLMTLRPTDNSLLFLNELKDKLSGRNTDGSPITHSSGEPQLYLEIDMSELVKKGVEVD
jgi:Circadian oscillating protein COP23